MKCLAQMLVVFAITLMGEPIAAMLPFPFPASLVSLVLLLITFLCGALRPKQIEGVSNILLNNLSVLFVPAGVGVLQYWDVFLKNLWPIFVVCLISTPLVYAVTAQIAKVTMNCVDKRKENPPC